MPDLPPSDDERTPGRLLLLLGLVVVAAGVALCASAIMSGGVGSGSSFGGRGGPDLSTVPVGVAIFAIGALIVAVGAVLSRSAGPDERHSAGFSGAYLDADDDRW